MKEKLLSNKGFTLIEVIVVLVILSILMAMAMPSIFGYTIKGQRTAAIAECRSSVNAAISSLSDQYVKTNNRVPNDNTYTEAKNLAQVDGDIELIEKNENYIVSYLKYKYSDKITAIYKEGKYYILGVDEIPGGGDGSSGESSGDGESGGGGGESSGGGGESGGSGGESGGDVPPSPEEPSTESSTEVPSGSVSTVILTDEDNKNHIFTDTTYPSFWDVLKASCQEYNGANLGNGYAELYADHTGVFVFYNGTYAQGLDRNLTLEEFAKTHTSLQITSSTPIYTTRQVQSKEQNINTGTIWYNESNDKCYIWVNENIPAPNDYDTTNDIDKNWLEISYRKS